MSLLCKCIRFGVSQYDGLHGLLSRYELSRADLGDRCGKQSRNFPANLAPLHQNDNELKFTHSLISSNPDKAEYSVSCEHINSWFRRNPVLSFLYVDRAVKIEACLFKY
jgi:hypothetical protein